MYSVNPLTGTGNYSATSNNMKLVHRLLMGGLLHLVQRGGAWAGPQPAHAPPRCTKCNSPPINGQCTNHQIAVRLLLCGFRVPIKGLTVVVSGMQLTKLNTRGPSGRASFRNCWKSRT